MPFVSTQEGFSRDYGLLSYRWRLACSVKHQSARHRKLIGGAPCQPINQGALPSAGPNRFRRLTACQRCAGFGTRNSRAFDNNVFKQQR